MDEKHTADEIHIFPTDTNKRPLTEHGLLDATNDPTIFAAWWRKWPGANMGIALGASGLVAVDAEGLIKHGVDGCAGWERLKQERGFSDEGAWLQDTPSGGLHVVFSDPYGEIQPANDARLGGHGYEVRAGGQYILGPGAFANGEGDNGRYSGMYRPLNQWIGTPAPVPQPLREYLLKIAGNGSKPQRAPPVGDAIPSGSRNATLASLAGTMRRRGMTQEAIEAALLAENTAKCKPPLLDDEVMAIAASIGRYAPAPDAEMPEEPRWMAESRAIEPTTPLAEEPRAPEEPDWGASDPATPDADPLQELFVEELHLTDMGNSRRLALRFGLDLRFTIGQGWFVWDGRRWALDDTNRVHRYAREIAKTLYADAKAAERRVIDIIGEIEKAAGAGDAGKVDDLKAKGQKERRLADALLSWALRSQGKQRLDAMVALAQSEPEIAARPADFDKDPMLLTCANGTLDLATGQLRPHRRADMITKNSPVAFDPSARSEEWECFLVDATGGDKALEGFLRRASGYSLTGLTIEEVLLFIHGPTATGKSTFMESFKAALGDYAHTADFESFLKRQQVGQVRNDIAAMAGARLVASIEVEEGKEMAEALVAQITGGDTVSARFLYREAFPFAPAFKLWLVANHAPRVQSDSGAMWRRILRLPFERTVPVEKRDPKLKARLKDPNGGGPAILAWAVAGCTEWQAGGLAVPECVRKATAEYRKSQDVLADFVAECCILGGDFSVAANSLRTAYEAWCRNNGIKALLTGKLWGQHLRALGCTGSTVREKGAVAWGWKGLGLLLPQDADATLADEEL